MGQQERKLWKIDDDPQSALTEGIDVRHGQNEGRVGYSVGWMNVSVKNADQFIKYAPSFGFR